MSANAILVRGGQNIFEEFHKAVAKSNLQNDIFLGTQGRAEFQADWLTTQPIQSGTSRAFFPLQVASSSVQTLKILHFHFWRCRDAHAQFLMWVYRPIQGHVGICSNRASALRGAIWKA